MKVIGHNIPRFANLPNLFVDVFAYSAIFASYIPFSLLLSPLIASNPEIFSFPFQFPFDS